MTETLTLFCLHTASHGSLPPGELVCSTHLWSPLCAPLSKRHEVNLWIEVYQHEPITMYTILGGGKTFKDLNYLLSTVSFLKLGQLTHKLTSELIRGFQIDALPTFHLVTWLKYWTYIPKVERNTVPNDWQFLPVCQMLK